MPVYVAKEAGTLPDGRRVRAGTKFVFEGKPGKWMQETTPEAPPPVPPTPAEAVEGVWAPPPENPAMPEELGDVRERTAEEEIVAPAAKPRRRKVAE